MHLSPTPGPSSPPTLLCGKPFHFATVLPYRILFCFMLRNQECADVPDEARFSRFICLNVTSSCRFCVVPIPRFRILQTLKLQKKRPAPKFATVTSPTIVGVTTCHAQEVEKDPEAGLAGLLCQHSYQLRCFVMSMSAPRFQPSLWNQPLYLSPAQCASAPLHGTNHSEFFKCRSPCLLRYSELEKWSPEMHTTHR